MYKLYKKPLKRKPPRPGSLRAAVLCVPAKSRTAVRSRPNRTIVPSRPNRTTVRSRPNRTTVRSRRKKKNRTARGFSFWRLCPGKLIRQTPRHGA